MQVRRLEISISDLPPTRLLAWELHAFLDLLRERDPEMAAHLERILARWQVALDEVPPLPS